MESWRRRGEGRGGEGAGMRRLLSREQQADRWISRDFVVVIDTRARSRASLSLSLLAHEFTRGSNVYTRRVFA